jgi:hypothetical protein
VKIERPHVNPRILFYLHLLAFISSPSLSNAPLPYLPPFIVYLPLLLLHHTIQIQTVEPIVSIRISNIMYKYFV